MRILTISVALMALAIHVAIATPATLMWKTTTSKRLSKAFTTPAAIRMYNERFVSPMLRRMAAAKLNTMRKGIPQKYILR